MRLGMSERAEKSPSTTFLANLPCVPRLWVHPLPDAENRAPLLVCLKQCERSSWYGEGKDILLLDAR